MKRATCYRRLQFRSGPESMEFRACEEHRPLLVSGDVTCFMLKAGEVIHELDAQTVEYEDIDCDLCREG